MLVVLGRYSYLKQLEGKDLAHQFNMSAWTSISARNSVEDGSFSDSTESVPGSPEPTMPNARSRSGEGSVAGLMVCLMSPTAPPTQSLLAYFIFIEPARVLPSLEVSGPFLK